MNKSDLRGIDKVIREENAIIKICMDKKLVRKMIVNKEEGKDIVFTGSTLKRLLKTASKQLLGKEDVNQICVHGVPTFDSTLDELLKYCYFIIFKDQVQDFFKIHVIHNVKNLTLSKCESPFKNGVYGLLNFVENLSEKEEDKQNNF